MDEFNKIRAPATDTSGRAVPAQRSVSTGMSALVTLSSFGTFIDLKQGLLECNERSQQLLPCERFSRNAHSDRDFEGKERWWDVAHSMSRSPAAIVIHEVAVVSPTLG